MPTAQEICFAAITNVALASEICETIEMLYDPFRGKNDPGLHNWHYSHPKYSQRSNQAIVMCAIIVIQSIADGAPYLAALGDVEACVAKWDPVYLC